MPLLKNRLNCCFFKDPKLPLWQGNTEGSLPERRKYLSPHSQTLVATPQWKSSVKEDCKQCHNLPVARLTSSKQLLPHTFYESVLVFLILWETAPKCNFVVVTVLWARFLSHCTVMPTVGGRKFNFSDSCHQQGTAGLPANGDIYKVL